MDLPADVTRARILEALAATGRTISSIVLPDAQQPDEVVAETGDLTITIGLGESLLDRVEIPAPPLSLPTFAGDEDLGSRSGGDLLVAAYASNAAVLAEATDAVMRTVSASLRDDITVRSAQHVFRGSGTDGVVRNPLGHLDGIIIPRTDSELDEGVWVADGPWSGGTVHVIRMLGLDRDRFVREPVQQQEQIIGRSRSDGSPLSGGGPLEQVDLLAKTPEGEFVTPLHSHVRAAHPSFTGSALMLRRGYGFDNGFTSGSERRESGLMFCCFQSDLETFIRTQHRLDAEDALMEYSTTLGSWSFAILPGFSADSPLGSSLHG